jgi:hypothetical protein
MINFPTLCIDNFYNEPDKIREYALKQDFLESPGNYPGKRTRPLHELNKDLFIGFCSKLFSIYYSEIDIKWNVETSFWKVNTLHQDPKSPKNMGFIHEDGCLLAGVIYLSPGFDSKLGTTIYRQIKEKETLNFLSVKKFYSTGEDDKFDDVITKNNSAFEEVARIGNVYNRLISFDGNIPHSPSHYYMKDETRLAQVFFVRNLDTNKSTSPMNRIRNHDNIPYNSI